MGAGDAAKWATVGMAGGSLLGPVGSILLGGLGGLGGALFGGSGDDEAQARAEAQARQEAIANQLQSDSQFQSSDPNTIAYQNMLLRDAQSKEGRATGAQGWTPYLQDRADMQDAARAQQAGLQNYQWGIDRSRADIQNAGRTGSLSDVLAKNAEADSRAQAQSMAMGARGGGANSALAQWQAAQMAGQGMSNANLLRAQAAFQEKGQAENMYTGMTHGNQNATNAIMQNRLAMGNQSLAAQAADDQAALAYMRLHADQLNADRGFRSQAAANAANIRSNAVLANTSQGNIDRTRSDALTDRDFATISGLGKAYAEQKGASGAMGGNPGGGTVSGGGGGSGGGSPIDWSQYG